MKKNIGSFSLMKRMNTALILNLIRESGAISRAELAKETGLTAATVTNLTAELIENKLVEEFNTGVSTGGRKPILLKINSGEFSIASASVTSDKLEFAVSDFCAKIKFYKHLEIDSGYTPQMCVDFIIKSLEEFRKKDKTRIIGIGVGVHGVVDSAEGVSVYAPNLNWRNVNIKSLIEKHTDIPVMVDNDVRLMALAEMWFGTSKKANDFVYLYVGSGVGSAIVINKQLLRGANDAAGEIGHTVIDTHGPVCECGKSGCLQAFTSEKAMISHLAANLCKTEILTASSSCDDIVDAYLNHSDKAAGIVLEKEIEYLSIGLSNIINVFNPGLIVLSSPIKNFDIAVCDKLSKNAGALSIANGQAQCRITYSSLGTRAIISGAAAMVLATVYENPGMLWDNKNNESTIEG